MSFRSKSTDSFNTRKRFFIFDCVLNNRNLIIEDDFIKFEITEQLVQLFTAEYYQIEGNKTLKSHPSPLTINEIYARMKSIEEMQVAELKILEKKYFEEIFKSQFPENTFNELNKADHCYYCGLTMQDIELLADKNKLYKKNERGWHFEIDRKKPNLEYTVENCVAACYWCNNAKTDEFDDIEFKPIGEQIGSTLKNRLLS
ncbi:MAG: hypothetical protein IPM71_08165 [Bacteroidota bacterium]|nr:MAG: hypothetical protein IPM71_08165 [Bacteroidota bacterium]